MVEAGQLTPKREMLCSPTLAVRFLPVSLPRAGPLLLCPPSVLSKQLIQDRSPHT